MESQTCFRSLHFSFLTNCEVSMAVAQAICSFHSWKFCSIFFVQCLGRFPFQIFQFPHLVSPWFPHGFSTFSWCRTPSPRMPRRHRRPPAPHPRHPATRRRWGRTWGRTWGPASCVNCVALRVAQKLHRDAVDL